MLRGATFCRRQRRASARPAVRRRFSASSACSFEALSGTAFTALRSDVQRVPDRHVAIEHRHRHHQARLHLGNLDVEEHAVAVEHEAVRAACPVKNDMLGLPFPSCSASRSAPPSTARDEHGFHHANRMAAALRRRQPRGRGRGSTGCGLLRRQTAPGFARQSRPAEAPGSAREPASESRSDSAPEARPSARMRRPARPASPRLPANTAFFTDVLHLTAAMRCGYSDSIDVAMLTQLLIGDALRTLTTSCSPGVVVHARRAEVLPDLRQPAAPSRSAAAIRAPRGYGAAPAR